MTSGKILSVYRSNSHGFLGRRQLPLVVEENLTVLMEFDNICNLVDNAAVKNGDLKSFSKRFNYLSKNELSTTLVVERDEIFAMLSQFISCVGCRRSVERLFDQLAEVNYIALEPLFITSQGQLTIDSICLKEPRVLFTVFHVYGPKLLKLIESIPRTKKNRRCLLHSLDGQRLKPIGWVDVWNLMEQECRDEVLYIDTDILQDTLDTYLRKHRFCAECKSKVMRAFSVLIAEVDSTKEKGFMPNLYDGIKFCPEEQQIHVNSHIDFVCHLMDRAEPELKGSRREKHAKTMEIAQGEVLVCIGICLYERMNRIWQRAREEEQTWQILSYIGVSCLRKNFELAVEEKQGFSQLELVCEEISKAEQAKQHKKDQKRQKRRKRRNRLRGMEDLELPDDGCCHCEYIENNAKVPCQSCCEDRLYSPLPPPTDVICSCGDDRLPCSKSHTCDCSHSSSALSSESEDLSCKKCSPDLGGEANCCVDCGYSSGNNDSVAWSSSSSCDSCCSQEDNCLNVEWCHHSQRRCHSCEDQPDYRFFKCSRLSNCSGKLTKESQFNACNCISRSQLGMFTTTPSLEDMLEDSSSGDEEGIPMEVVQEFKSKMMQVSEKRRELRQLLRQRFANLQKCNKFWWKPIARRWSSSKVIYSGS